MARRGSGLAARLRKAVEQDQSARTVEEKERSERLEAARRARVELFDDLAEVGRELGFAAVERSDEGVVLRRVDRFLKFTANGPGEQVDVDFTGRDEHARHRLYREAALDLRWIWVRERRGREDRVPLFDQGLEVLLVHALDLPDPAASSETAAAVRPGAPDASGAHTDRSGGDPAPTEPPPVKRTL
ncbi:MAG: hypothetical protein R3F61_03245 [Myxococcota bacterium]